MGFWKDLGNLLSGSEDTDRGDNLTAEQEAELKQIQAVEEEVRQEVPSRSKILQAKAREEKMKEKETPQRKAAKEEKSKTVTRDNISRTSIAREMAKRNRNKAKDEEEIER